MSKDQPQLSEIRSQLESMLANPEVFRADAIETRIREILARVDDAESVTDQLDAIRAEILNPVSAKIVDLVEEHRHQAQTNRWFGWLGITFGAFSLVVYFLDPLGKDNRIDSLEASYSSMETTISGQGQDLSDISEQLRVALRARVDPENGLGFTPTAGEIRVEQYHQVQLLANERETIKVYLADVQFDRGDGVPEWMYAQIEIYQNDGRMSDVAAVRMFTVRRADSDLPESSNLRWRVGDVITFDGLYRFQVSALFTKRIGERDRGDRETEMYLLPLEDGS